MPLEQTINTEPLLTIMGIVAAAWAIIPRARLLQISLNLSWIDWALTGFALLLANYLTFEPLLSSLGLYYSIGPWLPGLESASATYIIFMISLFYLSTRSRLSRIPRSKLKKMKYLADSFISKKQYDDLAKLIEPELNSILKHKNTPSLMKRIEIRSKKTRLIPEKIKDTITTIANKDKSQSIARSMLLNIAESKDAMDHLSITNPNFCMRMLDVDTVIQTDLSDRFISSITSNPRSIIYTEIKLNTETKSEDEDSITNKLFRDPDIAANRYAIDKAIGNHAISLLNHDNSTIEKINTPSKTYETKEKYSCPIYAAIYLLDIMVKEEINNGYQDQRSAYWIDRIF